MPSRDLFLQLGHTGCVFATEEEVAQFVASPPRGQNEVDYVSRLAKKYQRGSFLLPCERGYEMKLITAHSMGRITDAARDSGLATVNESRAHTIERHISDIATARKLMRIALRLFEVLQRDAPVTTEDMETFGITRKPVLRFNEQTREAEFVDPSTGIADCTLSVHIPWGDYLEYLGQSCQVVNEWLIDRDCYLDTGEESKDAYTGYLSCRHGATLEMTLHEVTDNAQGRRDALTWFLNTLLDLHLVHVRPLAFGIGDCRLLSLDELTALWVRLRESATGGGVGICLTCGTPFIAGKGRRFKRAYCSESCKRAYLRTTQVIKAIEGGKKPEQAMHESGISVTRIADIAKRNGLLKPGIDYGLEREEGGR